MTGTQAASFFQESWRSWNTAERSVSERDAAHIVHVLRMAGDSVEIPSGSYLIYMLHGAWWPDNLGRRPKASTTVPGCSERTVKTSVSIAAFKPRKRVR